MAKLSTLVMLLGCACASLGCKVAACPRGTTRVYCAVDLWTAPLRASPSAPPPTCATKSLIVVSWCHPVGAADFWFDAYNRLRRIIAANWPQDIMEFSQNGGLWAAPASSPTAPVCSYTNDWTGSALVDLNEIVKKSPGKLPQDVGGEEPGFPACSPGVVGSGGGSGTCLPEWSTCATSAECCDALLCGANGYCLVQ